MNFGLFLTWWDHLLGTLKLDAARNPSVGDIGIQDHGEFPQDYMTQLVLPFIPPSGGAVEPDYCPGSRV